MSTDNRIITIYLRSTIARGKKGYFHEAFDASATIDDVFVVGSQAHFDAIRKPYSVALTCAVSDSAKWADFKAKYQTKKGLWKKTSEAKEIRYAVEAVEDKLGWRMPRAEIWKAQHAAEKAMDDARDAYRQIAYDPYQPGLRGWYDDSKPGAKEAKKAWLKAKREYEKAMSL